MHNHSDESHPPPRGPTPDSAGSGSQLHNNQTNNDATLDVPLTSIAGELNLNIPVITEQEYQQAAHQYITVAISNPPLQQTDGTNVRNQTHKHKAARAHWHPGPLHANGDLQASDFVVPTRDWRTVRRTNSSRRRDKAKPSRRVNTDSAKHDERHAAAQEPAPAQLASTDTAHGEVSDLPMSLVERGSNCEPALQPHTHPSKAVSYTHLTLPTICSV